MSVYHCECGLTISTSSQRPQCLRCRRVLDSGDSVKRLSAALIAPVAIECQRIGEVPIILRRMSINTLSRLRPLASRDKIVELRSGQSDWPPE
jgi:hypothetical protein